MASAYDSPPSHLVFPDPRLSSAPHVYQKLGRNIVETVCDARIEELDLLLALKSIGGATPTDQATGAMPLSIASSAA